MLKLCFGLIKLTALAVVAYLVVTRVEWKGTTVSDRLGSSLSSATRTAVPAVEGAASGISRTAESLARQARETASEFSIRGEKRKAPISAKQAETGAHEEFLESEREKLKNLIRELNAPKKR